ncbi:MAG: substrate-binding domain-containing protein [Proteobacteria bacterium]|nr:substrate-binding domain-containing protein [Pseudomonadota bacterium]MBU4295984.1 substrate-binding domain-containing protein [Pseudomonadota bacterium]MCG2747984.1 substrate-binding domain-containing protein [Desulfobulbaceae bacterium]
MLTWPEETVAANGQIPRWQHPGSNLCLDLHGDPAKANLVVFSDGNHHMALQEAMALFQKEQPEVQQIFYVTTPPGPVLQLLRHGSLQIGNLILSVKPHVFISPPAVLDNLVREKYMQRHMPFMRNQGSVLLVKKGNPKNISGVADLNREDVRLFLSNPTTETVSYQGYVRTLADVAAREKVTLSFLTDDPPSTKICYGEQIHHREAPQAIIDGRADVSVVYYHLALRYTRIFPELFAMIPLGGTIDQPQPYPENVISLSHAGLIGDGGGWGAVFLDFLASEAITDIYTHHGLLRA